MSSQPWRRLLRERKGKGRRKNESETERCVAKEEKERPYFFTPFSSSPRGFCGQVGINLSVACCATGRMDRGLSPVLYTVHTHTQGETDICRRPAPRPRTSMSIFLKLRVTETS